MKCKKYAKIGNRQRQIIELLKKNGPMRLTDIADAMSLRTAKVADALVALAQRGIAEKAGHALGPGAWSIRRAGPGRPRKTPAAPKPRNVAAPMPRNVAAPKPRPGFFRRVFGWLGADAR